MIPSSLIVEIRRLLSKERWSHRTIARRLGVHRGTVNRVAFGCLRRPLVPAPEDDTLQPEGPPARCPQCGAMVYGSCLSCRLHEESAATEKPQAVDWTLLDEPIGLDLKPRHRLGYEEVHARLIREEASRSALKEEDDPRRFIAIASR